MPGRTRQVPISVRLALAGSVSLAAVGVAAFLVQLGAAAEPARAGETGLLTAAMMLPSAADPAKVVGAERCQKCHEAAVATWNLTPHAKMEDMLNSEDVNKITKAMSLKQGIKRNELCMTCHCTTKMEDGKPKTTVVVTCESCHGAAAGWVDSHQDYGGAGVTKDQETAAHRDERWKTCDGLGMIRKDRLDRIAENCFNCHTTPIEDLVNKGGHKPGSDFELVALSQGQVRHNFLGDDKTNRVDTPQRLRVMYVVGKLVELEVTLRNLASAKEEGGEYYKFMSQRAERVKSDLRAIQTAVPIDEVKDSLEAVSQALAEASAKVKTFAEKFSKNDGSKLEALDPLLPKPESYKLESKKP